MEVLALQTLKELLLIVTDIDPLKLALFVAVLALFVSLAAVT